MAPLSYGNRTVSALPRGSGDPGQLAAAQGRFPRPAEKLHGPGKNSLAQGKTPRAGENLHEPGKISAAQGKLPRSRENLRGPGKKLPGSGKISLGQGNFPRTAENLREPRQVGFTCQNGRSRRGCPLARMMLENGQVGRTV